MKTKMKNPKKTPKIIKRFKLKNPITQKTLLLPTLCMANARLIVIKLMISYHCILRDFTR